MEHWKTEVEKQYEWQRKGKKYKTKYFGALKELYGRAAHDKECQVEGSFTNGKTGTDNVCGVVKKNWV